MSVVPDKIREHKQQGEPVGLSETMFDRLLNTLNLAREEIFVY